MRRRAAASVDRMQLAAHEPRRDVIPEFDPEPGWRTIDGQKPRLKSATLSAMLKSWTVPTTASQQRLGGVPISSVFEASQRALAG